MSGAAPDRPAEPPLRRRLAEIAASVTVAVGLCGGVWFAAVKLVLDPMFSGWEVDPREGLYRVDPAPPGSAIPLARPRVPASAGTVTGWSGGGIGGSTDYLTFGCDSLDACFAAVVEMECGRGPTREEFTRFEGAPPATFAVTLRGPRHYGPELDVPWWNFAELRGGFYHESHRGSDWLDFYLIDPATGWVYYHHESGGFDETPAGGSARGDSGS